MNIWRLIAHHEEADNAIDLMKNHNRIAIGWSEIGDLSKLNISDQSEITALITNAYPTIGNAHLGGPSLWNLYNKMQDGDFVILNSNSQRKCVFEVIGPYIYEAAEKQIIGYAHQRPACLTNISPDKLWNNSGSSVLPGQNVRWTLTACSISDTAREAIYTEGTRFSVTLTAIERSPVARQICLDHFGYKCFVCDFNFEKKFGELGKDFIHIHHRVNIANKPSIHEVDPKKDLIPLCPNCHAMAHRKKPAIPVEELKNIYASHNA
jgi:hypothetical protein